MALFSDCSLIVVWWLVDTAAELPLHLKNESYSQLGVCASLWGNQILLHSSIVTTSEQNPQDTQWLPLPHKLMDALDYSLIDWLSHLDTFYATQHKSIYACVLKDKISLHHSYLKTCLRVKKIMNWTHPRQWWLPNTQLKWPWTAIAVCILLLSLYLLLNNK